VIEIRVHPHGSEETQASDRIAGSRNDQIEQAEHLSAGSPKEAMVPCCVAAALSFRKDRTTQGWYSAQLTRVANDSIALRFAETLIANLDHNPHPARASFVPPTRVQTSAPDALGAEIVQVGIRVMLRLMAIALIYCTRDHLPLPAGNIRHEEQPKRNNWPVAVYALRAARRPRSDGQYHGLTAHPGASVDFATG